MADQGTAKDQLSVAIAPGPNANVSGGSPAQPGSGQRRRFLGHAQLGRDVPGERRDPERRSRRCRIVHGPVRGHRGLGRPDARVLPRRRHRWSGLAAGSATTTVSRRSAFPAKLPHGTSVSGVAYARIYAIVDPEDVINQALRSNNMASSSPVLLSVVNGDANSKVPTYRGQRVRLGLGLRRQGQGRQARPRPPPKGRQGRRQEGRPAGLQAGPARRPPTKVAVKAAPQDRHAQPAGSSHQPDAQIKAQIKASPEARQGRSRQGQAQGPQPRDQAGRPGRREVDLSFPGSSTGGPNPPVVKAQERVG